MKKPLVSIIIPCYNVEFLIFRLLDSILLQNYSNVEVIAIDGWINRSHFTSITIVCG